MSEKEGEGERLTMFSLAFIWARTSPLIFGCCEMGRGKTGQKEFHVAYCKNKIIIVVQGKCTLCSQSN